MEIVKSSAIPIKIDKPERLHEYVKALDNDVRSLFQLSHGRVRFGSGTDGSKGENVSGEFQVVADTGTADTQFAVTHTLGAVPIGFIVLNVDKGGIIYNSGTAWTATTAYFKCTTANTNVTLFLLK